MTLIFCQSCESSEFRYCYIRLGLPPGYQLRGMTAAASQRLPNSLIDFQRQSHIVAEGS